MVCRVSLCIAFGLTEKELSKAQILSVLETSTASLDQIRLRLSAGRQD
jgi:hypothetical protein